MFQTKSLLVLQDPESNRDESQNCFAKGKKAKQERVHPMSPYLQKFLKAQM